jgi:Ni/Fe-hydrogenase subunit HybB-like protein
MLLVLLEIWFVYRPEIIRRARETTGPLKALYWCLALGCLNDNEATLGLDHKIIGVLAAIGIPSACILHGYVGFLFGSLKANPWWSSPLMPVIFLLSAIVSGIAILIVCYWLICRFSSQRLDHECLSSMFKYLWAFFILDVAMEGLELLTHLYEGHEEWHIVSRMLTERLGFSFYVLQIGICSVIPVIVLGFVVLKKMRESTRLKLGLTCAVLILVQVLAMRWNVVIGGQLFSRSLRGLTSYTPTILGREGLLIALIIFTMPFVVMYVFNLILPLFDKEPEEEKQ